ncbi:MAG TPA: UDP-glucose 4-epimerase GalE [archaeon]|nr:UDP-glucose 4-epimerase GalE [archaeon]
MKVLLTGGAGYIGSHANKLLNRNGVETVVLDNLSRGHAEAVKWGRLEVLDLLDYESLARLFRAEHFDAVLHFAAYIFVGESVKDPETYYLNNVVGSLNLLRAMREHSVDKIIFSSTAAVYGTPRQLPIPEKHPLEPISPYGWSKLAIERMIIDYGRAFGMRSIIFRYFNAAGADPECETGENHDPENHLIPLVLKAALDPGRTVTVFGTDYDTRDGTCIRDYIHVNDLTEAHLLGLQNLIEGQSDEGELSKVYNIGNGSGFSVQEVIETSARVTGRAPSVRYGARRAGDPPVLVASSDKLRSELGWKPRYPDLESIIAHAWAWEQKLA